MSRPLRVEFSGALYHATARGDRREPIFENDHDRQALLEFLGQALERFDASCLAYCLMPNHYHFVLETRRANLSRLVRGSQDWRWSSYRAHVGLDDGPAWLDSVAVLR